MIKMDSTFEEYGADPLYMVKEFLMHPLVYGREVTITKLNDVPTGMC